MVVWATRRGKLTLTPGIEGEILGPANVKRIDLSRRILLRLLSLPDLPPRLEASAKRCPSNNMDFCRTAGDRTPCLLPLAIHSYPQRAAGS